jgi:hypothetical protein
MRADVEHRWAAHEFLHRCAASLDGARVNHNVDPAATRLGIERYRTRDPVEHAALRSSETAHFEADDGVSGVDRVLSCG